MQIKQSFSTEPFFDHSEQLDTVDIMDEYFGQGPALNKARVVDGGNFESVGSPIANEDTPILASNLYESAPSEDEAE